MSTTAKYNLVQPESLSEDDLRAMSQVIYEAFSNHPLLPYEIDDWSVHGVQKAFGGFFQRAAGLKGLWLARSNEHEGGLLGIVCMRRWAGATKPKPNSEAETKPPAVPKSPAPAPAPVQEKEESSEDPEKQARRKWRNEVADPWTSAFCKRAYGDPTLRASRITFLAVSPKAQGMGIGKALMNAAWERSLKDGVGMTLLTKVRRTMEWYLTLGYTVLDTDELDVLATGKKVTFWAMHRPPPPKT